MLLYFSAFDILNSRNSHETSGRALWKWRDLGGREGFKFIAAATDTSRGWLWQENVQKEKCIS